MAVPPTVAFRSTERGAVPVDGVAVKVQVKVTTGVRVGGGLVGVGGGFVGVFVGVLV